MSYGVQPSRARRKRIVLYQFKCHDNFRKQTQKCKQLKPVGLEFDGGTKTDNTRNPTRLGTMSGWDHHKRFVKCTDKKHPASATIDSNHRRNDFVSVDTAIYVPTSQEQRQIRLCDI